MISVWRNTRGAVRLPGACYGCLGALFTLVASAVPVSAQSATVNDITFEIGVGYDSNPYLTPDDPYFDQNRQEILTPRRISGFTMPANLDGEVQLPLGTGAHRFVTDYRVKGEFHPESDVSNADETWAKLEPGLRFHLGSADTSLERFIGMRSYAAYKKDVYFDRDTGSDATSSGLDVSSRYEYTSAGVGLDFEYEITRNIAVFVEVDREQRDYEDPEGVESFDHDRSEATGGFDLRLPRTVRLSLEYGYQLREYEARHARSADGDRAETNPLLEYGSTRLMANLRFKPARPLTIEMRWIRGHRADRFVDYNEYDEDSYRARATLKTERTRWRLSAALRNRDYDNAFIFDDPLNPATGQANPKKSQETAEFEFEGHVRWRNHLWPYAKILFVDQESVDPRFAYDRYQAITGLELRY